VSRRPSMLGSRASTTSSLTLFLLVACGGTSREKRIIEIDPPDTGGGSQNPPDAARETSTPASDAGDASIDSPLACSASDVSDGGLELISVGLGCRAAHGDASSMSLSADGGLVFYQSDADDIVANDLNGTDDIFMFDRTTRRLERISVDPNGGPANHFSFEPVASDDGRHVVFTSMSTNVVPGAPQGIRVYLRDRTTRKTALLPATYECAMAPGISGDGSVVVWEVIPHCDGSAAAADMFGSFVFESGKSIAERVGLSDGSDNYEPAISRNGRWLAWGTRPPLTRGQLTSELKLLNRATGELQTVPIGKAFNFPAIALSTDAEVIAYSSNGDLYRYSRVDNQRTVLSKGPQGEPSNGAGYELATSADGRRIVFSSQASNLVPADTNGVRDIFLFEAGADTLRRVSVTASGAQADDESRYPAISADGKVVAFASKARNLLPAATSGDWQTYVLKLEP